MDPVDDLVDDPAAENDESSRVVPFFQTLIYLPVQGEQAAAGLLLESLVLMRELKRMRKDEALYRETIAAGDDERVPNQVP